MIKVSLPADYDRETDSLSVTIDDGKDSNTYPIQLETKSWLIDTIVPVIRVYCSWALLACAFLSAIAGLPEFFVWGGIFVLQLIAHVPLFTINMPLNEIKFLAFMNHIVSFDLFETKPLARVGFTQSEPFN